MVETPLQDGAADMIADMLMDFTDTLFYNFKTDEASQRAFERIAEYLGIFRAAVYMTATNNTKTMKLLYETETKVTEESRIEEKSLHSIAGSTYTYRVYRHSYAKSLNMTQRRTLEFVFKMLHTYLNRQSSMEMTQYAKTHDMLYGCLNLNGLSETLKTLSRTQRNFGEYATVFMNIQKFRTINAKVGFENGNIVMRHVISSICNLLSDEEYFAHIGGDNFSLLLKKETLQEKLDAFNAIKCEVTHEGRSRLIEITFMMGVYLIEADVNEISEMLENANIAYSFARRSGTQIVYYNAEKRGEYEYRKMLENALIPALNSGEYTVYFQPKVRLEDGRLVGAEALSRWMHNGTMMTPDSFISIFEQNGMIVDIDFHVFEFVCRSLRAWMDEGIDPVTVSVNFSKISLERPNFADRLLKIANQYQIPLQYLEVEFTESFCMENERKFCDILKELKRLGFSASLDDFGKGYSSINMLKNMDFDVLKLDRTFLTAENEENQRAKIILKSIIKMAQSLNIQVVSEGVENTDQIDYLKQLKCEEAQGYFFDSPLPPNEFVKKLRRGFYTI